MPLITSTTQLNKYKFGMGPWSDTRDSGNSNQPYITKDIPGVDPDNPNQTFEQVAKGDLPLQSGPDFILRDGFLAPVAAVRDVSRLAQMLIDFKSPNGPLFIAKQNLLSRTSVETQATSGIGYGGTAVNQGIYTPLSTLGQAAGGFAGAHLNLLGIDPTSPISGVINGGIFPGAGLNTYDSIVNPRINTGLLSIEEDYGNRLVEFTNNARDASLSLNPNALSNPTLYSYSGGPGSILGIGKTNIKFADQRTGLANKNAIGIGDRTYQTQLKSLTDKDEDTLVPGAIVNPSASISPNGLTISYENQTGVDLSTAFFDNGRYFYNVSNPNNITENTPLQEANNSKTYTQKQLIDKKTIREGTDAGIYPTDFRKELYGEGSSGLNSTQNSSVISLSPNYRNKNKDKRLFMGQPGRQGGQKRNTEGTNTLAKNVWNYGVNAVDLQALDKLTASPMYESVGPDTDQAINDLVKFRIAAINNDRTDGSAVYMHFRAFLDSFTDGYTATWNPVNYVGRGDTLYNYGGFGRSISLSFTVAAQSKAELIPMHKKLNYLASTLAPDYTEAGFMRGNLVRLTVGGYLYEQPGFITSLNYDIPQDSTWEIAINEEGGSDSSVKELPHMIKVSGFNFTPIHDFLPQKPNDPNNPTSKFISLSNGVNSNYDDVYESYTSEGNSGGGDNNIET